jgi:hypothetical protein
LVFARTFGADRLGAIERQQDDAVFVIAGLRSTLENSTVFPVVVVAIEKFDCRSGRLESVPASTAGTVAFVVSVGREGESTCREMGEASGPAR